jgi:hypothetical protein
LRLAISGVELFVDPCARCCVFKNALKPSANLALLTWSNTAP